MRVDDHGPKTIEEIAALFGVAGDGDDAIRDLALDIDRLKRAQEAMLQLARLDPQELSKAFQRRGKALDPNLT